MTDRGSSTWAFARACARALLAATLAAFAATGCASVASAGSGSQAVDATLLPEMFHLAYGALVLGDAPEPELDDAGSRRPSVVPPEYAALVGEARELMGFGDPTWRRVVVSALETTWSDERHQTIVVARFVDARGAQAPEGWAVPVGYRRPVLTRSAAPEALDVRARELYRGHALWDEMQALHDAEREHMRGTLAAGVALELPEDTNEDALRAATAEAERTFDHEHPAGSPWTTTDAIEVTGFGGAGTPRYVVAHAGSGMPCAGSAWLLFEVQGAELAFVALDGGPPPLGLVDLDGDGRFELYFAGGIDAYVDGERAPLWRDETARQGPHEDACYRSAWEWP